MQKRIQIALLISMIGLLFLAACSGNAETEDWKVFTIEQEPGFDIQFRLPPGWLVDYAPTRDKPGQWDVILVPPRCSPDQAVEYQENCITLVAHIKGTSTFNEEDFMDLISSDIPLGQGSGQTARLLEQDNFRVNRLKVSRFNHLIGTSVGEVQMSTYYFETDQAYYTFITNFPLKEGENETSDTFDLLLGSVKAVR